MDVSELLRKGQNYFDSGKYEKAINFFKKAVFHGSSKAKLKLADMNLWGLGTKINENEYLRLLDEVANSDDNFTDSGEACLKLYKHYMVFVELVDQVEEDYKLELTNNNLKELNCDWRGFKELAFSYLERAANKDNGEAKSILETTTNAKSNVYHFTPQTMGKNPEDKKREITQKVIAQLNPEIMEQSSRKSFFSKSTRDLIKQDEGKKIEFKETFETPKKGLKKGDSISDKHTESIRHATFKAMASFFNTNEGIIILGVKDSKSTEDGIPLITGIEADGYDGNKDNYKKYIVDMMTNVFPDEAVTLVDEFIFERILNKTLCRIHCKESTNRPVFFDYFIYDNETKKEKVIRDAFFVRRHNTAKELRGDSMFIHMKKYFKNYK